MAVPEPRGGFADHVLSHAVAASHRQRRAASALGPFGRWETWLGATIGAAAAVLVTLAILRPQIQQAPAAAVTLALNEARSIDVVIDSERTLEDATIRLATTGAVQLDGFDGQREVEWQARLERGRNVLSLPVVARAEGAAELVAVVEHEGRSRRIAIHMVVKPREDKENV
jgi:hypothetical protein